MHVIFLSLHSTMFLLIPDRFSIFLHHRLTLHSTMFLLILAFLLNFLYNISFTFHYVSINTWRVPMSNLQLFAFTFHYVSINTDGRPWSYVAERTLHSTMFLLIRRSPTRKLRRKFLYIPLCFY